MTKVSFYLIKQVLYNCITEKTRQCWTWCDLWVILILLINHLVLKISENIFSDIYVLSVFDS